MSKVDVFLADAYYLSRLGIRHLLDQHPQFRIVGEVTSQEDLINKLPTIKADVLILDYDQPGYFTPEVIQQVNVASPKTRILVISADNEKKNIFEVLKDGVHSFLTKECDDEEILNAIRATSKGEKFFCNKILDLLLERSFNDNTEELDEDCSPTPLSEREKDIVRLVANGKIAKEIASELNLSKHTVYTHRKNIMRKLKINSTSQLVLYAITHGIIPHPIEN